MPRNPRSVPPRAMLRALTTTATAALLLIMTALPAFAASAGTKPTGDDPHLIGSLPQLGTAAIVGIVIAIIVWVMMAPETKTADDEHH